MHAGLERRDAKSGGSHHEGGKAAERRQRRRRARRLAVDEAPEADPDALVALGLDGLDLTLGQSGVGGCWLGAELAVANHDELAGRRHAILNQEQHRRTGLEERRTRVSGKLSDVQRRVASLHVDGVRALKLEVSLAERNSVRVETAADDNELGVLDSRLVGNTPAMTMSKPFTAVRQLRWRA